MTQIQLDALDHEIIAHLIDDGRKSFKDIAEALDVSAGTVRNRFTRLQEHGTLRVVGFVDLDQAGINAYATIYLRVNPSRLLDSVMRELEALPETAFVAMVAGEYDIHVDVHCLNNAHLTALLRKKIHQIEGVTDTQTTMVLKIQTYSQPLLADLKESAEMLTQES